MIHSYRNSHLRSFHRAPHPHHSLHEQRGPPFGAWYLLRIPMAENSQAVERQEPWGSSSLNEPLMEQVMENRHHPQHIKKLLLILGMMLVLTGCLEANRADKKSESYQVGEDIYVCGCPMMCCNSYSREPGRCICNVPLRKATVTRIHNGKMYVTATNGRVKSFLIPEK